MERLRADNDDLSRRIREIEKERAQMQTELHELNTEKGAWLRVEQGLKEKIHKLQQEYYQSQLRGSQHMATSVGRENT